MRFKDKVVLVTGAARNTGLAIVEAFASEGATVVLNGRKEPDVTREVARLCREFGANIIAATADVSQPDAVEAMFASIQQQCGQLDVLVNNAIIQGTGFPMTDTPRELLEEVFRVNVFGTYWCSQSAARMMIAQAGGTIVNIGSNTAERAIGNRSAYCASKAAIDGLTRAMAVELGPLGIRVNCVVPGYIHTPRWNDISDKQVRRRRANIPLGAEAAGSDIADAVMFLASSAASKINGARLAVDGGCLAQLLPADCNE